PRAFTLTVFAAESFIDAYLENPYPHLGRALLLGADATSRSGVLTASDIAERNARDGMQLVVANCALPVDAFDVAMVYGTALRSFFDVHRGYRIDRVTHEVFGQRSAELIHSSHSYQVQRTFDLSTMRGTLRSLVATV